MATTTIYPDAGTGNDTVDGHASQIGSYLNFTDIVSASGSNANATDTTINILLNSDIDAFFSNLSRGILTFDTSEIGSSEITSAKISFVLNQKITNGTAPDLHVVSSSPASNSNVSAGDYDSLGSTDFGSVAYADVGAGVVDITLNSSGIVNINKNGISKFGLKLSYDLDDNFTGSLNNSSAWGFIIYSRDHSLANSPRLTITYTPVIDNKETISINSQISKSLTRKLLETIKITDFFQKLYLVLTETIKVNSLISIGQKYTQAILESIQIHTQTRLLKNGLIVLWGKIQRPIVANWNKIIRR